MTHDILTLDGVVAALAQNGWEDTTVHCPDGTPVTISPCSYVDIHSLADCDWFLVYGDLPWSGGSDLAKIVDELNRHEERVAEADEEKARLRAYFAAHELRGWDDDSWSWYSDWHKDCYGYRPHGHVCGEYVRPY